MVLHGTQSGVENARTRGRLLTSKSAAVRRRNRHERHASPAQETASTAATSEKASRRSGIIILPAPLPGSSRSGAADSTKTAGTEVERHIRHRQRGHQEV